MTTDDRTARLSTPANEQPTVDLGATAVLTEERPSAGERPAAEEPASSQQARRRRDHAPSAADGAEADN
ncbi:hypothetical protein, partial [Rathayibacter sp. AY1A2]|uniref:hypothetical protein n=1 Tax=Rathayibacter sp. AY1A2 TaxID=2080520 RepID=UPI001CA4C9D7